MAEPLKQTIEVQGYNLALVGLNGAVVEVNGSLIDVTGVAIPAGRTIVDCIVSNLAPGAELYASVECYRMGIPLRSQ